MPATPSRRHAASGCAARFRPCNFESRRVEENRFRTLPSLGQAFQTSLGRCLLKGCVQHALSPNFLDVRKITPATSSFVWKLQRARAEGAELAVWGRFGHRNDHGIRVAHGGNLSIRGANKAGESRASFESPEGKLWLRGRALCTCAAAKPSCYVGGKS